uniref:Amiloride-sensitive sodium channel n=1 Tax=Macrostomum lignano TaxID=282301 RepID=A0A1I8FUC8_9PLAT
MRARLRTVTGAAQEVAGITRTHGLLHIFLSRGTARRLFWLLLFVAALIGCTVHLAKLVQKFTEHSVESQLKLRSEQAQFPEVTICNFKPLSASVGPNILVSKYFPTFWANFVNWFKEDTPKRPQESDESYESRLETVCKKVLDVMWVSDDTRDISHLDETMLLRCRYNNEPCSHKNFSLVQTSRFWNCYTFHPDPKQSSSGSGGRGAKLDMVLFTDGYIGSSSFTYRPEFSNIISKLVCLGRLAFNMIAISRLLNNNQPQSNGLRIFFHEAKSYPLTDAEFVDVASARSTSIKLRPIHNRLVSTPSRRCSEPPLETINYVRYFSNASTNVVSKEYFKSISDFVFEAQQSILQSNCGCYSHLLPFSVNTSDLCYFAPPQNWITPSDAVLKRISCHDLWFEHAQRRGQELVKEFQHRMRCDFTQQRPWQQSRSWPPLSAIQEISEELIAPLVRHGMKFRRSRDGKKQHMIKKFLLFSRKEHVLLHLLDQDYWNCTAWFSYNRTIDNTNTSTLNELLEEYLESAPYCLQRRLLSKNLAAVSINLQSPAADAYEEKYKYHWTEALSEIGGALGLWLGISVRCRRNDSDSDSEEES